MSDDQPTKDCFLCKGSGEYQGFDKCPPSTGTAQTQPRPVPQFMVEPTLKVEVWDDDD